MSYPNSSRESHASSITRHLLCPVELRDKHLTNAEINTDPALRRDVARSRALSLGLGLLLHSLMVLFILASATLTQVDGQSRCSKSDVGWPLGMFTAFGGVALLLTFLQSHLEFHCPSACFPMHQPQIAPP